MRGFCSAKRPKRRPPCGVLIGLDVEVGKGVERYVERGDGDTSKVP